MSMAPFVDEVVSRQSDPDHPDGLSSDEATRCLERFGPNDLIPARKAPSVWSWIVKLGSDPMALLLIATALTYLVVGGRVDAIVVSVALVPIFLVSAVLEIRADAAIDRLREAVAPRVRVRRDGVEKTIAARDVVPGDIIVVNEGDVLVADGCLLPGGRITCDESTLSGDSIPVDKGVVADDPLASELFAGTTVAAGTALARVTATCRTTRDGRIGGLLAERTAPPTPIERSIRRKLEIEDEALCPYRHRRGRRLLRPRRLRQRLRLRPARRLCRCRVSRLLRRLL